MEGLIGARAAPAPERRCGDDAVTDPEMTAGVIGYLGRMARSAKVRLDEGGVAGFADALRAFLWTRERLTILAIDLSAGYAAPALDPRIEVRAATAEDLDRLRALPEGGRTEFHRDRIDGAEPWVALWEGQLAHIAWIYDSGRRTRFLRLRPGEAEVRDAFTLEPFRGRGLYPLTNAVMAAELARRGYQRVFGLVAAHGAAFRLGLELALMRVGFRRVATVLHWRVLGVQLRPHLSL
ncbi:MAG TPA: hypothetical protein VFX28_22410 [Methylomirabilota bacterium]|nr:hypothetical protein [Methylomirabilota bacterium]